MNDLVSKILQTVLLGVVKRADVARAVRNRDAGRQWPVNTSDGGKSFAVSAEVGWLMTFGAVTGVRPGSARSVACQHPGSAETPFPESHGTLTL